jgi:hypothetical protein
VVNTRALEVGWRDGVMTERKGWRDLDAVIARAQSITLAQETADVEGFEAVWRIRDRTGEVSYFLIPRIEEDVPMPWVSYRL